MNKIIAIANQKGGVGKTTTTANMGFGLAKAGKKVLMIDFDSQASLTQIMQKKPPDDIYVSIATHMERFVQEQPIEKSTGIIEIVPNRVDLFPSNIELANIDVSLVNAMSRENVLRRILSEYRNDYDYILIDCNPSLGMLSLNALTACDSVIIPVTTQFLSAKGLESLLATIGRVKKQLNPRLSIEGILLTMVQRTNHSRSVIEAIKTAYGKDIRIFDTLIPYTVKAQEAGQKGQGIFDFDPNGKLAQSYTEFVKEVENIGRKNRIEKDR